MSHRPPSRVVQGFFPGSRLQPRQTAPGRTSPAEQALATLARGGRPPGQPLPPAVQAKMENIFRADFSNVRVHEGSEPAALGALALTMGSDLYFAPGQYNPHTPTGQRLLGHELTHVVQQRAGRVRGGGTGVALVQDPSLEAEAERMALLAVARPLPAAMAPPAVQHAGVPGTVQPALRHVAAWGAAGAAAGAGAGWLGGPVGSAIGGVVGGLGGLGLGAYRSYVRDVPPPVITGNPINANVWRAITANVPRHLRFTWAPLANLLFNRLLNSGISYHLTGDEPGYILGFPNGQGNCKALAKAFTIILNAFDFGAETRAVRPEGTKFIVHAPNFFDPAVVGHIYTGMPRAVIPGYFMFSNHWATWVPKLNRFYDPMANATYTQAQFNNTIVQCNVIPDPTRVHQLVSATAPHTFNGGNHFALDEIDIQHLAGFYCYQLT